MDNTKKIMQSVKWIALIVLVMMLNMHVHGEIDANSNLNSLGYLILLPTILLGYIIGVLLRKNVGYLIKLAFISSIFLFLLNAYIPPTDEQLLDVVFYIIYIGLFIASLFLGVSFSNIYNRFKHKQ